MAKPIKRQPPEDEHPLAPLANGKDEMNLAEFPIGRLGVRDKRETLTYDGWFTDRQGRRYRQRWMVSGSKQYGLPHELGNRMLVAFITLASEKQSKEVQFTDYQMLRLLRLSDGKANYKHFERNLLQLAGLTIYSEQAFWDNELKKHITTKRAFHIFEDVWLSSWVDDDRQERKGQGYVVFNDVFWGNIQSGYLKSLDLELYLGTLKSSIARQLYRCLDKFMRYRLSFEIDIFDLASRIGMRRYTYPSKIKEKLQPAIKELVKIGFLESAAFVKVAQYTRVRFVKRAGPGSSPEPDRPEEAAPAPDADKETLPERYGVTEAFQTLWGVVLANLKQQVTPTTYHSFVEPTLLLSIEGDTATVLAGNPAAQTWLQSRMAKQFKDELNYHLRARQQEPVKQVVIVSLVEESQ